MPKIPQYPAQGQRTQLSPLVISLRREGEDWTWKFNPEVFRPDNAGQDWREMGPRVVATPGRNTIVYGEQGLLFTADSAKYIRELGETDIPIIAILQARHHVQGGDKNSRWNGGVVLSVAA